MRIFRATAGMTYQIAVDGYCGATGNFDLSLQFRARPANDNFANRIALSGATNAVNGHNLGATKEPGEPNHSYSNVGGTSAWWSWTPPSNGSAMVTVPVSSLDDFVLLSVYTSSTLTNLTRIVSSIGYSKETWLATAVAGPGLLTYWWKVSSASGYDFLELYLNGVQVELTDCIWFWLW